MTTSPEASVRELRRDFLLLSLVSCGDIFSLIADYTASFRDRNFKITHGRAKSLSFHYALKYASSSLQSFKGKKKKEKQT